MAPVMLMIRPHPRSAIAGANSSPSRRAEVKFSRNASSQTASSSGLDIGREPPALLTRTSTRPAFANTARSQLFRRVLLSEIGRQQDRLGAARGKDLARQGFERRLSACGGDDAGAFGREQNGGRPADAGASPALPSRPGRAA